MSPLSRVCVTIVAEDQSNTETNKSVGRVPLKKVTVKLLYLLAITSEN